MYYAILYYLTVYKLLVWLRFGMHHLETLVTESYQKDLDLPKHSKKYKAMNIGGVACCN